MAEPERHSPEMRGKLRQFNRVVMSYVDFQQACGIACYMLGTDLFERYPHDRFALQGLNSGLVAAYGRPFSDNRGGPDLATPALPGRLLGLLSPEERQLHEAVVRDRNTVVAHSDASAWNPKVFYLAAPPDRTILVPSFSYAHAPLVRSAVEQLERMADTMREACFAERERFEVELRHLLPVVSPEDLESGSAPNAGAGG